MGGTAGALVRVDDPAGPCPVCGGSMRVQKTLTRRGLTLAHGGFRVRETVHACAARCTRDGQAVIRRQPALAELLLPRSRFGYDVLVYVGLERFVRFRQRDEIRATLAGDYGIHLSAGETSELGRRFLVYLEALHQERAGALRARLDEDGGWPMHVDATGEDGRGTLLAVYAGWRHWVLGAWKIPTERADAILPKLRGVAALFGPPCAVMRDLGRAVIEATRDFVATLREPVPVLGCHMHFLRDIGKDLLAEAHDTLRALFRGADLKKDLRALARDLGRRLGHAIDPARDHLEGWLATEERGHRLPDGRSGLAAVRAVAQWVLDYPADGRDEGFPFDLPQLDLYHRCRKAARAVEAFLGAPPCGLQVRGALRRLHRILIAARQPAFQSPVCSLEERRALFTELRDALRVEVKATAAAAVPAAPASPEALAELREVKAAIEKLTRSLRDRRPQRGPAQQRRQAIDIVLEHLDRHGPSLWGHAIPLPSHIAPGVRLVERTNVMLEHFFKGMKHGERRRSGRKILSRDFEDLPAAAALAPNLLRPDYVETVCGTLDNLPAAFARLDAQDRSAPLPVRLAASRSTCSDRDIASASMPTADRKIIRAPALTNRILAAARSRAPYHPAPGLPATVG